MRKLITLSAIYLLLCISLSAQNADVNQNETINKAWTYKSGIIFTDFVTAYKYIGAPFDLWVKTYDNNVYIRDIHRSLKFGGTYNSPSTTPSNSWIYSHEWGNSADEDLGAQTVKMRGAASTKKWQWAVRTDSYGGSEILSINNEGSGRVGINQPNPGEALDVNGNIRTNQLYLKSGGAIYSLHNSNYILKDHANGNVTLSAAGTDLYLGYQNTNRIKLITSLYDASGSHKILSSNGSIDQARGDVTNYFSGNVRLRQSDSGSSKLMFRGHSSDMVYMFSEEYTTGGTRMVTEVADDDNDYIQFRHRSWNNSVVTNLLDLKKTYTTIYKPLGIGGNVESGKMLTVHGAVVADEIEVKDIAAANINLAGDLAANNITLTTNGNTADFVFEPNYNLKSLSEVENFILTNKHLPDIPSAEEMEEQGVNLAEMNKLLLQKVEELTLYQIEKDKEMKALEEARKKEQAERNREKVKREKVEARLAKLEQLLLNEE